ncbi:hypothetical protein RZS08_34420, partial [Arthrospira platensis SPKY1]|nr:hypothetical protein [Arthrospira platensis SPKY1]
LNLRHLLPERARQRHGEHARQGWWETNRHATDEPPPEAAHFFAQAVHLVKDAAAVIKEQFAGIGRESAPAVAHQQGLAQLHLELPDLTTQSGLGHAQGSGGAREAAHLGHPDEVFQLLQIHANDCKYLGLRNIKIT